MMNRCLLAVIFGGLAGCSAEGTPRPANAGNLGSGGVASANTGGASKSSGGATLSSGGSQVSSGGSGGPSTASGGSGASPTSGGTSNPAAGGSIVTGGSPAAGGAVASLGGAASGGASSGELTLAAGLNHRLEVPCIKASEESSELCESAMTLPPKSLSFGGDPQSTYKVTLRFRGVTEGKTFSDSNNQKISTVTQSPYFLDSTQGHPNVDDHACFWIEVAAPQKSYYVNAFHSVDGEFDHKVHKLDYKWGKSQ